MIVSALMMVVSMVGGAVHLHGGVIVDEAVVSVSLQGVAVGDGVSPSWISWDRVREVRGERSGEAEQYLVISDDLWRARTRLARGDVALAEPIFAALFERFVGTQGATSLVVAEGRMRCALQQGQQADAVIPWLEVVRLRGLGEQLAGEPPLPPIVDAETSLLPALPPLFLAGRARELLGEALRQWMDAQGESESIESRIALLYWQIIEGEVGEARDEASEHAGVALLEEIVDATSVDGARRARGQRGLRARIESQPDTWVEAWCRVALGESLIAQDTEDSVAQGVLELLHVPARFGVTQVYLTGYALDRASVALGLGGDAESASLLLERLLESQPLHPAAIRRRDAGASQGLLEEKGPA